MSNDIVSPASPLETMHEAMHQAQANFLRDLTKRIRACFETFELCTDELQESRLDLSPDVSKNCLAADKHLLRLIEALETECADLTEQSSR